MTRTLTIFSAAFFLAACSTTSKQASLHETLPDKFDVFIGGFFGASYDIQIEGDHLLYTEARPERPDFVHKHSLQIRPTAEEWRLFWKEAEALDLWRWRSSYQPPAGQAIDDGTQWRVEISCGNRHIKSTGDNAYPSDKDARETDPNTGQYSGRFRKFNEAIRRLIHGLPYG